MKKTWTYIVILLLTAFVSAFAIIKSSGKNDKDTKSLSALLPRKVSLAYPSEWDLVKTNAETFMQKVRKDPSDIKSLMNLTAIYLQEARITGNFDYYNQVALKCIARVLEKEPSQFEALTFKATILLSMHQFEEGYKVASQARQLFPYNAYVYGLLTDANIELGRYQEALETAEQMVSIRPDIRSYSRIAYLREIYGDLAGAAEAMELAVDAGAPGDENTEWCRVQLGQLCEKAGSVEKARMYYTIADNNRKNYPYSLSGLARIAVYEKDYTRALSLYLQADSLIKDHSIKEGLVEVYELTGQLEKARQTRNELLTYMKQYSSDTKTNDVIKQNEDNEIAHAYMASGNYDLALQFAQKEYNRRATNIEVNETMALVYYKKNDFPKAAAYIARALSTNCKNPDLLCNAGLIYAKAGETAKAKQILQEALKNKPLISFSLKQESEAMLQNLD